MTLLRASAHTHPMMIAKAIAGMIHDHNHAEVQAIGIPAVHQTINAIALATAHLKEEHVYIAFTAMLIEVGVEDNMKEGFRFIIDRRG